MAGESDSDAFGRGHRAGGIDARLDDHDQHFRKINGSIADMVKEMHQMTLAVQRLGDQAVSRDATVVTTAAALKDADDARRSKSDQSWSPIAKALAVIAAAVAVLGLVGTGVGLYLALGRN